VSRYSESVRRQMRETYDAVQALAVQQGAPALDRSRAYGEMGKLYLAAGDPESAEACLLNAQTLASADARWPYYLGQRFSTEGQPADNVPALISLGSAHLALGRPESAEPLYRKAVALEPNSASALVGLGRAALARRDYAEAVARLERALTIDRRASAVHYPLALAYRGLGDAGRADAHLRQRGDVDVRMRDPLMEEVAGLLHSAMAYEMTGRQALIAGQFQAAADDFRKGIALAADNPTLQATLRQKLGTALFQLGDARGGVEQFEQALQRAPEFAPAHYSLGVVMMSAGRYPEAIAHLTAAVKTEPNYLDAHLRLGDALLASGRPEPALAQYEAALAVDARVPEARFGCAMALVRAGRFVEARDRLVEGMSAHPGEPAFAHALARLLAAAPDDRVRDGRKALALAVERAAREPASADRDEAMAMALAEVGEFDKAVAWQRTAMKGVTRSANPVLYDHMAMNLALFARRSPSRTPWSGNPSYEARSD
jgi:tetratricopeptide (TPR) repeat protein